MSRDFFKKHHDVWAEILAPLIFGQGLAGKFQGEVESLELRIIGKGNKAGKSLFMQLMHE